jgi:hypothetical protein
VNLRIVRHVSSLAPGQRPADGFPRPVGLQVHASEGEVLHYLPGQDGEEGQAAVEGEGVVQAGLGGEVVEGVDVLGSRFG